MDKTIMTVDDAGAIRRMVASTLRESGHAVVEASDGVAALQLAGERLFDLIITDFNMPHMDGLNLTRKLRALPEYRHVPIVLLTTESSPELKEQGRVAGASGWLLKPFKAEQLVAVVSKLLAA